MPKSKKSNNRKSNNADQKQKSSIIPVMPQGARVPANRIEKKRSQVKLSKCALKFALAASEPFHPKARGVCGVFGFSAGDTYKVSALTRFSVTTGTAGDGFVALSPAIASDAPIAFVTTSAYTLNDQVSILTAANVLQTGVTTVVNSQIPFSTTQLLGTNGSYQNAPVQGRLIAMGVRINYIGTTMNQSGNFTCLAPISHYNVSITPNANTVMTLASLQTDAQAKISQAGREWCNLTLTPTYPYEMGFSSNASISSNSATLYPYSNGATSINTYTYTASNSQNVGSPIGIIYINGAQAGAQFQVEVIQHLEYAGNVVGFGSTPGETDEQGGMMVLRAAQQMESSKNSSNKRGWPLMHELLEVGSNAIKEHVIPAAISAVVSLL